MIVVVFHKEFRHEILRSVHQMIGMYVMHRTQYFMTESIAIIIITFLVSSIFTLAQERD